MKKNISKLAISLVGILLASTLMVGASYAWLTMSTSPVATGINVTIGGGNTILLAPDMTKEVLNEDGEVVTVHYPGDFEEVLNISQYDTYNYLKDLGGIKPVSTADGIHWIIPAYDEQSEKLKSISEFTVDTSYQYANLEAVEEGSYICLDFWIVSPGAEYDIRVSTDIETGIGSYLLELPSVTNKEDGSLTLKDTQGIIHSSIRVGFLVNRTYGTDESMQAYARSGRVRYNLLLGRYPEMNEKESPYDALVYDFTIYEPNATIHPAEELEDGSYIITRPLAYDEESAVIQEMSSTEYLNLSAQTGSSWRKLEESLQIEQIFQTAIIGKTGISTSEAEDIFYDEYLQDQVSTYVQTGDFVTSTGTMYRLAQGRTVSAENMQQYIQYGGATEDAVITTLERNTPQRIRMFIWLEGQDADCINSESIEETAFSLSLELAGATKQQE